MSTTHGVIHYAHAERSTDYLYRISVKCLVRDANGKVLVVKERGRDWWDLPGGGMDHGESISAAIAREMREEVNLQGEFTYRIIAVEDPALLDVHGFWQMRLIFVVEPQNMAFSAGDDGDEVDFRNASEFQYSPIRAEQRIYEYAQVG